jgi:hypothetical protein
MRWRAISRIQWRLELIRYPLYFIPMSATEIAELCDALPPDKREEVADFARFLLARQQDARWEAVIADPNSRPRLDAFLRESATEADEALDLKRL